MPEPRFHSEIETADVPGDVLAGKGEYVEAAALPGSVLVPPHVIGLINVCAEILETIAPAKNAQHNKTKCIVNRHLKLSIILLCLMAKLML